jgi:hypothetical protein
MLGDLTCRHVRFQKQPARFVHDPLGQKGMGGAPRGLAADPAEMGGRDLQLLGIIRDAAPGPELRLHPFGEQLHQPVAAFAQDRSFLPRQFAGHPDRDQQRIGRQRAFHRRGMRGKFAFDLFQVAGQPRLRFEVGDAQVKGVLRQAQRIVWRQAEFQPLCLGLELQRHGRPGRHIYGGVRSVAARDAVDADAALAPRDPVEAMPRRGMQQLDLPRALHPQLAQRG